jgi:2-hydroxy-6-oxo-6-(2'-aminophenyl)hexa-2,4-dienoate hydrolase
MRFSDAHSRFVDAGGIRTRYLEVGQGAPLVLIHGGGAGADCAGNWGGVLPRLAPHFRVIAYDMVGFGDSDKPDPAVFEYSQHERVEHLRAFLEALDIQRASLIGNSMGGATALGLAAFHPQAVERLVLMGSAGLNSTIHPELLPVLNYDFTREGMVRLIGALTNASFEVEDELVDYRLARSLDPQTRAAYVATMGWIREHGGLAYPDDVIARVGCPTLVVNGKDDKVVPLANAYRFLELIPDSWGWIVPHCGHWAMIEQPEAFARVCLMFLKSVA